MLRETLPDSQDGVDDDGIDTLRDLKTDIHWLVVFHAVRDAHESGFLDDAD